MAELATTAPASVISTAESLPIGRVIRFAMGVAVAYYVAAQLGLALRFPGRVVSALWPPNAILLSALLLVLPRQWWIALVAIIPAHFAAHGDAGLPTWRLIWQIGHNTILAVCAATFLRKLVTARHPFSTLRDLTVFLGLAVLAAPAAAAVVSPNVVLSMLDVGETVPVLRAWRNTFLSNATAFVTLVPALVLWTHEGKRWLRQSGPERYGEALLLAATVVVLCGFALAGPSATPPTSYFLVAPLLWAAARFGVTGVTSVLFVIALASIYFAVTGRGPFAELDPISNVFQLQLFLLSIAVPVLLLAVLMEERAQVAEALRAGQSLLSESHAQIQDLARRLLSAQEGERAHIARELHDDIGQQIAALAIGLSQLKQHLPQGVTGPAGELTGLQENVAVTAHAVRNLSKGLHPALLQLIGLAEALRGYCREFSEAHSLDIRLQTEGEPQSLPPEVSLCFYRMTQEALRNVAEHAHARVVRVRLTQSSSAIVLTISDDGHGFNPVTAANQTGLGLVSLQERVAAVGGRLTVETTPDRGTTISVQVPLGSEADSGVLPALG